MLCCTTAAILTAGTLQADEQYRRHVNWGQERYNSVSCPLLLHGDLVLGPCCRTLDVLHVVLDLRLTCHVERVDGRTFIQTTSLSRAG